MSPKETARDAVRRAKVIAERTNQKERFRNLTVGEMNEWYNRSLRKYIDAAKKCVEAGDYKEAIRMYQGAVEYAPSESVREKIREKIEGLSGKGGKLERNLFSTASIISLVSALFFTSINLSGHATSSLARDSSLLGIVLFVLGLVFALVFFKSKKKKF